MAMASDMDVGDLAKFGYSPRHSNGSRKDTLRAAIEAKGTKWTAGKLRDLVKQGRFGRELAVDLHWVELQK
jgi:hypothetical protein